MNWYIKDQARADTKQMLRGPAIEKLRINQERDLLDAYKLISSENVQVGISV